jgi:hypothetical protein
MDVQFEKNKSYGSYWKVDSNIFRNYGKGCEGKDSNCLKQTLYHEKPFDFKLQYVVDMLS